MKKHWRIPVLTLQVLVPFIDISTATELKPFFVCESVCTSKPAHTHPGLINIHTECHSMLGSKHATPPAVIQVFFHLPNSSTLFKQGLDLPWNTAEFSCSSASGPGGTREGSVPLSQAQWTQWGPSSFYLQGQWCRRRDEGLDTQRRTWNEHHAPKQPSLLRPCTATLKRNLDAWLYKPPVNSSPQQAPNFSRHFISNQWLLHTFVSKEKKLHVNPTHQLPN